MSHIAHMMFKRATTNNFEEGGFGGMSCHMTLSLWCVPPKLDMCNIYSTHRCKKVCLKHFGSALLGYFLYVLLCIWCAGLIGSGEKVDQGALWRGTYVEQHARTLIIRCIYIYTPLIFKDDLKRTRGKRLKDSLPPKRLSNNAWEAYII